MIDRRKAPHRTIPVLSRFEVRWAPRVAEATAMTLRQRSTDMTAGQALRLAYMLRRDGENGVEIWRLLGDATDGRPAPERVI